MINNSVRKIILRILDISYRNKFSHIGSCLTAAPIIYEIYQRKRDNEKFVLSCGHAYLAQLVVMEYFGIIENAEKIALEIGTHPKRSVENHTDSSTGSLGMGLTVAVGFALSKPLEQVYCLVSDGEMAEGSIWESLHFINSLSKPLKNLHIYLNLNGYSALGEIDITSLIFEIKGFVNINFNVRDIFTSEIGGFDYYLRGLAAHYEILTKEKYESIRDYYKKL